MLSKYLKILSESLDRKTDILESIESKSREQSELIRDMAQLDEIDANMDEKDALITELIKLDEGFEALYDNIRAELNEHKDEHKDEITGIQDKIRRVMELSTSIEATEARNKAEMEKRFSFEKKNIQDQRKASSAAYDYYKVSNKLNAVTPQFMDRKK